jgi:hypothetical protein
MPSMLWLAEPAYESAPTCLTFPQEQVNRLRPGGDLAHMTDWGGKLTGAIVRIADLEAHGWIRPRPAPPPTGGRGRPSSSCWKTFRCQVRPGPSARTAAPDPLHARLAAHRRHEPAPLRGPDLVFHRDLSEDAVRWITALGRHGPTDSQCVALAILREEEVLDNRAYRTATGVDSRVATAELQNLVARELVMQTGTRRWAQYRLPPRLGLRTSGTAARANRRATLLAALREETLSRAKLAAGQASTPRQSGDG